MDKVTLESSSLQGRGIVFLIEEVYRTSSILLETQGTAPLIKENRRGIYDEVIFVPNTRRQCAQTKENFRVRTRSFFVPNTRRQFSLAKENLEYKDKVISVPNARPQFALIKENGRGVRSVSSFEEYRNGLEDKFNFALIKESLRKLDDEVIFVPKTRRKFALIKENGRE